MGKKKTQGPYQIEQMENGKSVIRVNALELVAPERIFNADCLGLEVAGPNVEFHFGMRKGAKVIAGITIQLTIPAFQTFVETLHDRFRENVRRVSAECGFSHDKLGYFDFSQNDLNDLPAERYMKYAANLCSISLNISVAIEWYCVDPSVLRRVQAGYERQAGPNPVVMILCSAPALLKLLTQVDQIVSSVKFEHELELGASDVE